MLSINIPVYNIKAGSLVSQLIQQADELNIAWEIRIYDDGSKEDVKKANRKTGNLSGVVYREMKKNLGRAAIRNKMGLESKFQYLLFIDADSKLISDNYLSAYLRYTQKDVVMCGGTAYSDQKPADQKKQLRWIYGTRREAIPAQQKNRSKGFIITSNNFLIEKEIFEKIHFRENIKKYGHEDTLMGYDLFRSGIKIVHFDNPVEHTGLENSDVFLEKTKQAIENLYFISNNIVVDDSTFRNKVNFLNKYRKIHRFIPDSLLRIIFKNFRRNLENNLTGRYPKMLLFDLYKLSYFSVVKNREQ